MPDRSVEDVVVAAIKKIAEMEPDEELSLDTPLFGDQRLSIDSLAVMELVEMIEEELDIRIDEMQLDFASLGTVGDVILLAEKYGKQ